MKCLIWMYLTETSQRYLGIMHDETKAWKYKKINSKHAKSPTDNFAV